MGMRVNRHQIYIYRQGEIVGDLKIFLAWWDVEFEIVLQLQQHGKLGCGMIGEIKADAGLNHLGLAGRLQVGVEH